MSRAGKLLSKAGGAHAARAAELLSRGVGLIRQSHEAGDADLSHEIMEANMLLQTVEKSMTSGDQVLTSSTSDPFTSARPERVTAT